MEKLSAKSIEKIELFLYMEDMNYISLSKHDMELLYNIYNKSVMELLDLEQENQELKQDIKNLVHIINHNCLELETTKEEYESLKRWQNK